MNNPQTRYAGVFSRLLAFIIDLLIVGVVSKTIAEWFNMSSVLESILLTIVWWLYTVFSISKWKGTVGNRIVGLYVLKTNMEPLSFWQASLRYFYFLSYVISCSLLIALVKYMSYEYGVNANLLLLLCVPPLAMMLFTAHKQTLYDYMAKNIVVDAPNGEIQEANGAGTNIGSHGTIGTIRKIMRGIFIVTTLGTVVYAVFYMSVMFIASGGMHSRSYEPVTTSSKTVDYNNTKIDYYKSELEKAMAEFIEADNMYDILHGDVKKDLALNCIRFFVKKEGNDNWLDEGTAYRANARNKYANTTEKVKKAYKNEDYMGHHFYDYDLNDVNHIEDKIADMWDINANTETCEQMIPAEKMYGLFILRYIENREEAKQRYVREVESTKDRKDREFYRGELDKITRWLEELHRKHPEYVAYKTQKDELFQRQKQAHEAQKHSRKTDDLWQAAMYGGTYGLDHFKNVNANIRNKAGQTPLMLAVQNKFDYVIDELQVAIVDVGAKDNQGKTAYDYIEVPANRHEKIFTDRLYASLKMLEIYQIVQGKAIVAQSGCRTKAGKLTFTLTLSGTDCSKFVFPENTQCRSR